MQSRLVPPKGNSAERSREKGEVPAMEGDAPFASRTGHKHPGSGKLGSPVKRGNRHLLGAVKSSRRYARKNLRKRLGPERRDTR